VDAAITLLAIHPFWTAKISSVKKIMQQANSKPTQAILLSQQESLDILPILHTLITARSVTPNCKTTYTQLTIDPKKTNTFLDELGTKM
jgi:hypothetical protein